MSYNRNKLRKHNVLAKSSVVVKYLPATRFFSKQNFLLFLTQFEEVFVKPSGGSGGAGVMKISTKNKGIYEVHHGKSKKKITGIEQTFTYVKQRVKNNHYIVQRRIALAKINGRPFDVRVMVQRKKGSSWTVTGKLAKVAGAGYIITNVARSKGRVMPLAQAIHSSNIRGASSSSIHNQLDHVALTATKQLQKFYKINIVGFDMGIDSKRRIWIIEPNFSPAKSLFLRLKDKTMYRRIIAYSRKK